MAANVNTAREVPGTYAQRRAGIESLVEHYFRAWESQRLANAATRADAVQRKTQAPSVEIPPGITFSRKIGAGALEIADQVALKKGWKVADREVIEYIARQNDISAKAIAYFDERFPGYVNRSAKYLFGEKSFIDSDYARLLIAAINAMAAIETTIFVGRGAHLILPRERVLAVRCICSDQLRIERIADTMRITTADAKKRLPDIDKEQRNFFKKVFGKKAASPYEFDLVINRDHFADIADIADIVTLAFDRKFKRETVPETTVETAAA